MGGEIVYYRAPPFPPEKGSPSSTASASLYLRMVSFLTTVAVGRYAVRFFFGLMAGNDGALFVVRFRHLPYREGYCRVAPYRFARFNCTEGASTHPPPGVLYDRMIASTWHTKKQKPPIRRQYVIYKNVKKNR